MCGVWERTLSTSVPACVLLTTSCALVGSGADVLSALGRPCKCMACWSLKDARWLTALGGAASWVAVGWCTSVIDPATGTDGIVVVVVVVVVARMSVYVGSH